MATVTYTEQNGYLIPDLIPPKAPKNLGVWGERRRRYLRDHKDGIYTGLLITGKLKMTTLPKLTNKPQKCARN